MKQGKKLSVPRSMDVIKAEAGKQYMELGQAQYQITILTRDVERLTDSLKRLNNEAHYRNQLDAQKASGTQVELPKSESVTNEQQ